MKIPRKFKTPCNHSGCPELTSGKYCNMHRKDKCTYNWQWRKARAIYLKQHPFCVYCLKQKKFVEATVVDHITPHRGEYDLFWDKDNWQALCKSCHDQKTLTHDKKYIKYTY